jgi:putative heme-binding domain-containing protein
LRTLAAKSKSPLGRVHALYALEGLKALDTALVLAALNDADPRLRAHALRLAEQHAGNPAVAARMEKMTEDADVNVRYQLAFSLGAAVGNSPVRPLAKLALRDGADPWFQLAVLSSANGRQGELFRRLVAEKAFRSAAHGRTLLNELAVQVGAAGRKDALAVVIKALDELPVSEKALAQALVRGLVSKAGPGVRDQLTRAASGKAGAILADLLRDARRVSADPKRKDADRAAAIRTLGLAPFAEVRELLKDALQLNQPQPVQTAALETLARFDHSDVPALVLQAWPAFSPQLRATAAETLFARTAWVLAFLDAVERGKVARGEVDPARIQLLQSSSDMKVRARAKKLFAGAGLSKRGDVVKAYRKALELKGDPARGKLVFKNHCSACHKLEGVGHAVGADLSAIRDQGMEAVLLNILDPNRDVKPQYLSYLLETKSGRTITGMITAETASSLTLRRLDGTTETVLRIDIDQLRSTGLSFMPEGLEKQIDVPAMADLLAYLNSIR